MSGRYKAVSVVWQWKKQNKQAQIHSFGPWSWDVRGTVKVLVVPRPGGEEKRQPFACVLPRRCPAPRFRSPLRLRLQVASSWKEPSPVARHSCLAPEESSPVRFLRCFVVTWLPARARPEAEHLRRVRACSAPPAGRMLHGVC